MKAPSTSSAPLLSLLFALRRWQRNHPGPFPWLRFEGIGLPRACRRRLTLAMTLLAGYCLAGLVGLGWSGDHSRAPAGNLAVASPESFSEVQAIKAELIRLRMEYVESLRSTVGNAGGAEAVPQLGTDPATVHRLECLIQEFSGTEESLAMTHLLLAILRRKEQWDRWMDVYLEAVYRHPTTPMVTYEKDRARQIARHAGREEELDRAFRYLAQIPSHIARFTLDVPDPAFDTRAP